MKTIELPRKLLVVDEWDLISHTETLKLKHEVALWLLDNDIGYTTSMPNVRGPIGVVPKIHLDDDREAMLFKLTWF
jgi:hypothetical protein